MANMSDRNVSERRSMDRVDLDTPYFISISVIGGETYKVMLTNLSAKGLQADLPLNTGADEIPGNSKVAISNFPEGMEYLNHMHGTVVWITLGCCGIQFDNELEDECFVEFLEHL